MNKYDFNTRLQCMYPIFTSLGKLSAGYEFYNNSVDLTDAWRLLDELLTVAHELEEDVKQELKECLGV